ncbi:PTCD3 isoform 2 [Pongo abelii]|uniref:Small ribosomal subunit protein mS39 n=1 Tax=Pongo abelii TaxID=9601 RepID=A0A2J8RNY7_PONAB|nr:PTCD3 isoform 2 [Pongo abelii]
MAGVSAVRWLGLRSRLGQPLTGRRAGLCKQARSCRFYSGSATLSKVEGTDITGIEEVVIPKKKTWDKVAVLQALASTVNRCLMPEYFEPQIKDISEAALKERIELRKVKASVDMFDQLLQAGTTVSLETTNSLLDLLCYFGDQEPSTDYHFQQTEQSEALEVENDETSRRKAGHQFGVTWQAKNNAERIFSLMPEKNAHSYCTMIRGMVKELLRHMVAQKVKPNLQTFNTILKCLRRFHVFARSPALQILREMKAIGIEPSLATYHHIIHVFDQPGDPLKRSSFIIYDIMNELMGKRFSPKDPDDDKFFQSAMSICSSLRDLELAYQVHGLLNTGDNWKFIGPDHHRNFYYSKFFDLICLMEQIDVTLKWYEDLIPSVYFPHSQTLIHLLQALDVANRLEMIPKIWKDSKEYGHTFRSDLREEILKLMARDKHPPELQVAFADCAADIKSAYESQHIRQTAQDWPATSLNCIAILFLRAGRTQEAWEALGNLTALTSDSDTDSSSDSDSDTSEGK